MSIQARGSEGIGRMERTGMQVVDDARKNRAGRASARNTNPVIRGVTKAPHRAKNK